MAGIKGNQYPGRELEAMSFAPKYHQWILDEFGPYLGQTVVEVGAGVGNLTTMLLQTELSHLYAFEPAANLFPSLKAKMEGLSRVSVINDYFCAAHVPDAIDSVLYINVLEHIEDDREALMNTYQALRTGGHLLLFVPALEWLFSEADVEVGHYRRYNMKNISKVIDNIGFNIEKIRFFDLAGVLPWYVNFVLLKNSFNSSSVALYDRLVVPPMQFFEKFIDPPVGKNILLIARKD